MKDPITAEKRPLDILLIDDDDMDARAVERAFRNPFSSITKESVGIIPSKDASATFKQKGSFQSVSAVEMETMRRLSEDLEKLLKQQDTAALYLQQQIPELKGSQKCVMQLLIDEKVDGIVN